MVVHFPYHYPANEKLSAGRINTIPAYKLISINFPDFQPNFGSIPYASATMCHLALSDIN
jgi:hypothetical protein